MGGGTRRARAISKEDPLGDLFPDGESDIDIADEGDQVDEKVAPTEAQLAFPVLTESR